MSNFLESEFCMHLREMAKHARAIALTGLLVAAAVLAYKLTRPAEYTSSATVRLSVDEQLADDGSITAFQTSSLAELATTAEVITNAAERAGITADAEAVRDRVAVEVRSTPGYLGVDATGPTAVESAALANAMAEAMVDRVARDAPSDASRSATVIDPADVADTSATLTTRQAVTEAAAFGLLSAILLGESLVALRLLRGRFFPIDPRVELERLRLVRCPADDDASVRTRTGPGHLHSATVRTLRRERARPMYGAVGGLPAPPDQRRSPGLRMERPPSSDGTDPEATRRLGLARPDQARLVRARSRHAGTPTHPGQQRLTSYRQRPATRSASRQCQTTGG